MKEVYQKVLKKVTFFLLSSPVPFNRENYQKHWPVAIQVMKQVQKNSFISYVLSDQFWVILKITYANLCKPIDDIISYSTFICLFESGKIGKEGKKLLKFEYLENEKSFWSFWRPIIWWKNKNLIKNSGHKL